MSDMTHVEPYILVGVDGSPESRRALRWAAHFAKTSTARSRR